MSRGATLSVLGIYNVDNTIFDNMEFPDGFTDEQKEIVKNSILVEGAELECLYPSAYFLKTIIGIWSRKELPYWQRVYNASLLEYNPIENYRRTETESITDGRTEEHSGQDVSTASGSDTMARSGNDTSLDSGSESLNKTGSVINAASGQDRIDAMSHSVASASGSDTENHKISGYDSNSLVDNTEDIKTYGRSDGTTADGNNVTTFGKRDTETIDTRDVTNFGKKNTMQYNSQDKTTFGKTDTLVHGEQIRHDGTSERSVLAFGNIGVTTSQDMLTQEVEVAKIINVTAIIVESFLNRFCLMVY